MIVNDTIHLVPKKIKNVNNAVTTIPLCKAAKRLIKDAGKYKVSGRIFETYSDQKTNEYIKDVARYLGINKDLHFHVARHTFATLFLEKTGDLASLQKLLGHASIIQTMVYVHVSETKKREQIKVFDAYI